MFQFSKIFTVLRYNLSHEFVFLLPFYKGRVNNKGKGENKFFFCLFFFFSIQEDTYIFFIQKRKLSAYGKEVGFYFIFILCVCVCKNFVF